MPYCTGRESWYLSSAGFDYVTPWTNVESNHHVLGKETAETSQLTRLFAMCELNIREATISARVHYRSNTDRSIKLPSAQK